VEYETIEFRSEGPVGILTLNRPESLNAINFRMRDEFRHFLKERFEDLVSVGAGFSIAMACDIRLAAPKARFQAAYINLGFGGADMGSSWLLPRAIGTGNAARYLLTGDFMDAQEALRIGFVQALVEQEQLMEEAMAIARNLATKSPLGLRLTKEALDRNTGGMSLEDAIRLEDRNQAMTIAQLVSGEGIGTNTK
jgi:enoyl-CoA hydratase